MFTLYPLTMHGADFTELTLGSCWATWRLHQLWRGDNIFSIFWLEWRGDNSNFNHQTFVQ